MKAVIYTQYGSPDKLQLKEVKKPVPANDEVLIRIRAASVNSWDQDLLTGRPYLYRLIFGILKPKHPIIGSDVAGVVEETGENVKNFKHGDEVLGDISGSGFGAFAEYVCVPENVLVLKPAGVTFSQAAAVPQAAVLALQGLRQGRIHKGQKVLINGAGGGAGTFAVQLAKIFGAEVTAVDRGGKLEMLRSLGADHVVDYTLNDFTATGSGRAPGNFESPAYDLILDMVAQRPLTDIMRVLKKGGSYIVAGGAVSRILQVSAQGAWFSAFRKKKAAILMHKPGKKDLGYITALLEAGKLNPVTDRSFPLEEVPEALRYFLTGEVRGKIIITMDHLSRDIAQTINLKQEMPQPSIL